MVTQSTKSPDHNVLEKREGVLVDDFGFESLGDAVNYRNALMFEFGPWLHGNILEVGSGIGQMSVEIRKQSHVDRLVSVEPDQRFAKKFRELHRDMELIEGTAATIQEHDWDAIVSINVLEHIEADEKELSRYKELLLNRKGHLCLFVPARPELFSLWDGDLGHFRRYTKPELRRKLDRAGFKVVNISYYNFIGYFAWLLNFRLLKARKNNEKALKLFDRRIFPVGHYLETHVSRPPFGQSLIVIAAPK